MVAICDPDQSRAQKLAQEFGAPAFGDYRQALTKGTTHTVSIAIPTFLHSEVACFAASQGIHILCEKPLALTTAEGQAMIEAAQRHSVKLAVSLQYRDGWPRRCRELIRQGDFGGPVIYRCADVREVRPKTAMHRRSMNGGPIVDMACHMFDLLRFMTGQEPRTVYARGHVFGQGKARLKEVDDFALDAAAITVSYDRGHILDFAINWGMPEGFPAYMDQMLMGPALAVHPAGNELVVQYGDHREQWPFQVPRFPPQHRIADLAAAINEDREPEITGADGLLALRVSMAVLESIETGRVVELTRTATASQE